MHTRTRGVVLGLVLLCSGLGLAHATNTFSPPPPPGTEIALTVEGTPKERETSTIHAQFMNGGNRFPIAAMVTFRVVKGSAKLSKTDAATSKDGHASIEAVFLSRTVVIEASSHNGHCRGTLTIDVQPAD